MKNIIKKIWPILPRSIKFSFYWIYESFNKVESSNLAKKEKIDISLVSKNGRKNSKKRILFYQIGGLGFGGTEKGLQIIAKNLPSDEFEVFYMAHWDENQPNRRDYFNGSGVKLINFSYQSVDNKFPYYIHKQKPDIFSVIRDNDIDIVFSSGAGYADCPLNLIDDKPIIIYGVFGYATTKKNVLKQLYISEEVGKKVLEIVAREKTMLFPLLSEGPRGGDLVSSRELRARLGISEETFCFGRIGRGDDGIFDPIGIKAFKKLSNERDDVAYIIMSPPPVLRRIVSDEKIKHVYFLEPSGQEDDIWAFHNAIDVLAHFRNDGESQGLNIVESMLCAKPVITHKSHIWNAHLEYLDNRFSRVAKKDDFEEYYGYMKEFVEMDKGKLKEIGEIAREKAESMFLARNRLPEIVNLLRSL